MKNPVVIFTAAAAAAKSLQMCLILCDPIEGSPPASPISGILQARILEWVAISFSKVYAKRKIPWWVKTGWEERRKDFGWVWTG